MAGSGSKSPEVLKRVLKQGEEFSIIEEIMLIAAGITMEGLRRWSFY